MFAFVSGLALLSAGYLLRNEGAEPVKPSEPFDERPTLAAATATAAEVEHFARAMTDLSWRMWHRHGAARPSFESHAASGADSPRGMARASASRVKGRRK